MSQPTASPKITSAGRAREDQQPSRAKEAVGAQPDGPVVLEASKIMPEPVEWLWPGRIPYGAITLLVGDVGLGKSLLSLSLVADLSGGRGELRGGPAPSLLLTAEDSRSQTVVPRLKALEADLGEVRFAAKRRDGIEMSLQFPDDIKVLTDLVAETEARLIVIDPLMAYLPGKVNSWMDQSVRLALAPLHRLAEASGAAMLVISHLNKGQSTDPLQRIGGSVGIPAAARSVLLLGRDPDDPEQEDGTRRVLAHFKSNLGRLAPSLAFEIEDRSLLGGFQTAVITGRGRSAYAAPQLLGHGGPRQSKFEQAIALLEAELADGPELVAELTAKATALNISVTTLERARKQLGVESDKVGVQEGWQWSLPSSGETASEADGER